MMFVFREVLKLEHAVRRIQAEIYKTTRAGA